MKELENLLNLKEGSKIELKKAENQVPKSFWETYSAFANTDGGIVIFGIDEKIEKLQELRILIKLEMSYLII